MSATLTAAMPPALVEETAGPIQIVPGKHGVFAINVHDRYVGGSLLHYGEFSDAEVDLLASLPERDVLVEVGANLGALTVPLSRHYGTVYAFEPQRLVYQLLVANLALNDRRNVTALQVGCGSYTGTLAVPTLAWDAPNNFGGLTLDTVAPAGHPFERVPMVRVQDVVSQASVLKIDVEGMEFEVLAGVPLAVWRPILYVENDRAEKSARLIARIRGAGYRLWWHRPRLFNPANAAGETTNVFGMVASHNMLCVPRESTWTPDVERFGLEPVEDA